MCPSLARERCIAVIGALLSLAVLATVYVGMLHRQATLSSVASQVLQHPEALDVEQLRGRLLRMGLCTPGDGWLSARPATRFYAHDGPPIEVVLHRRVAALPAHRYAPLPASFVARGDVVYGLSPLDPFAVASSTAASDAPHSAVNEMYAALAGFTEGIVINCSFHDGFLVHFRQPLDAAAAQRREDAVVVTARVLGQSHVWKWTRHQWGDAETVVLQEVVPAHAQLSALRLRYPSYALRPE
ncbi:hypothetical protein ACHHYP_07635 [Achlya hypogyna]|uniref:Uncharacterized protein n=1 Tax=Achlya hypogyna TaxID=1202772 RepID=A0A1V9YQQ0_ACHHY|nr:hypothetical protein ACHHYP_07635 [Achlya hypogyna]